MGDLEGKDHTHLFEQIADLKTLLEIPVLIHVKCLYVFSASEDDCVVLIVRFAPATFSAQHEMRSRKQEGSSGKIHCLMCAT
jgi:hypothetical protein